MQNERNSFDDKIRDRVEEYAYSFEQSHWDDMQRRLDAAMPVAWWKKWYNLLTIALFLLTGVATALYWLQTNNAGQMAINKSTDTLNIYKPESATAFASVAILKATNLNTSTFIAEKTNSLNSSAKTNQNLNYLQASEKGNNERPIIIARKARTFKTYRHSVRNALTSANNGSTPTAGAGNGGGNANRFQMLNTPFQALVNTVTLSSLTVASQAFVQSNDVEEGSAAIQFVSLNNYSNGKPKTNLGRSFRDGFATARYRLMNRSVLEEGESSYNSNTASVSSASTTTVSANNTVTEEIKPSSKNEATPLPVASADNENYSAWFVASYLASESTNRNSSSAKTLNEQGSLIGIKASYQLSKNVSIETGLLYVQNKYNAINQTSADTSFGMMTTFVKQKHLQIPLQVQYQIVEHHNLALSATAGTIIRSSTTTKTLDYVNNIAIYDAQGSLTYANTEQKTIVQTSPREWNTGINLSLNGVWSLSKRMKFVLSPYWQRTVTGTSNVRGRSMGVSTSINFKF